MGIPFIEIVVQFQSISIASRTLALAQGSA